MWLDGSASRRKRPAFSECGKAAGQQDHGLSSPTDTSSARSGCGDLMHHTCPVEPPQGQCPAGEVSMASKVKVAVKEKKEEAAPEKETPDTPDAPLPLLDLSDAAVRKMIKAAKKRGYVTHDQVNAVLPSEEVTSDQIEDVFAMLSEMGINVIENEEAETEEAPEESKEEAEEDDGDGDLIEAGNRSTPAETKKSEPGERTDDPVRMYLREMGTVELLSREGEIAIAKRIEAGREAMIAGLCESPLTFQAIIIWRDELNDGKVFLREIIDLEATYAGPDAKSVPVPVMAAGNGAAVDGAALQPPQTAA